MNVDRLIQTLNHIIQHPETWYQEQWHCGTSHCFAGHGQINSGKEINSDTCFKDAKEWYGLSHEDAVWLFAARRTLPEIHAFIKAAKDGVIFFDEDGYDRDGYDYEGYDPDGYDQFGFNRDGYDPDGYDRAGFNRDGYDPDGYDRDGYNYEGFNRDGFNRNGEDRSGNKLPLL